MFFKKESNKKEPPVPKTDAPEPTPLPEPTPVLNTQQQTTPAPTTTTPPPIEPKKISVDFTEAQLISMIKNLEGSENVELYLRTVKGHEELAELERLIKFLPKKREGA